MNLEKVQGSRFIFGIGSILGVFMSLFFGLNVVTTLLGIIAGIVIAEKMLNSRNKKVRIYFWVLFFSVIVASFLFRVILNFS